MAYKVLIPQDVMPEGKQYLTDRGYQIKMGSGASVEAIAADVRDCDAILARTASFPAAVLEAGKHLKVVARHGVGVDNVDVARATELGIWVTNAPESNSNTVAEHTVLLILALARHLLKISAGFKAGNFSIRNELKGMDLEGKTLGLLGVGRIGRLVARKMAAFDMDVVGHDPFVCPEKFPDTIKPVTEWDDLFARADFVSVHIPATPQTRGLIGAREFALMKPSAYFVNTARAEVVEEAALIHALKQGAIAGAGLDVFAAEPPEKDNPLLQLDNVVATPHNAALTVECMRRMAIHAAMGIDDVLSGRTPRWAVNAPRRPAAAPGT